MIRTAILLFAFTVAGCGSSSDGPTPPATLQSPGGNWVGNASQSRSVNLIISETGKLRAFISIAGAMEPPTYGAGSVAVSGTDVVSGAMRAGNFGLIGLFNAGSQGQSGLQLLMVESCSISGTVRERLRLTVDIVCSDDVQIVFDERVVLTFVPDYESGSSLGELAGNYAMRFRPDTDILNITADGTIFGTYGISPGCTINGLASEIDTRFNLLDVAWTLSGCAGLYSSFEGAEYDGFAMRSPEAIDPGSYTFFLTWERPEGLSLISTIYDPT